MSRSQLNLFEQTSESTEARSIGGDKIPVKQSTFLGGLGARVHRWFRLTPSFAPELVSEALEAMDTPQGAVVLDPFSGAGTTLIQARLEGFKAIGFELNPFLSFVCETSLNWELDATILWKTLDRISAAFTAGHLRSDVVSQMVPPPIHDPYRWWRRDVLADLILLKQVVRHSAANDGERRFFELALAGVLVPDLTNVTLGRLQLHFINKDAYSIDVWKTFERHAQTMIRDIAEVAQLSDKDCARVYNVDATTFRLSQMLPPVDRVVTSPPYPNRYSYVWNTRPHLYFFGFFDSPKQAATLDLQTIGGTWGTATSVLAKGEVGPDSPCVQTVVGSLVKEVRGRDNLMANYLMKYFNLLTRQIQAQETLLAPKARLAYVVGCSRLKGVYVETDVLLAELFTELGYSVERIQRFRKRHSGQDLHESIVYARAES